MEYYELPLLRLAVICSNVFVFYMYELCNRCSYLDKMYIEGF